MGASSCPRPPGFHGTHRLTLVACGTGHYACYTAKYWFEALARIPVDIDVASEFRYREPPLDPVLRSALRLPSRGNRGHARGPLRYCRGRIATIGAVVKRDRKFHRPAAPATSSFDPTPARRSAWFPSTKALPASLPVPCSFWRSRPRGSRAH